MPPPIIKKGTLLPLLQEETFDFDPLRGYSHHLIFKGASGDTMLSLQQDYARAGIPCRLTYHQGGSASLQVEDASQQFTIDTWEIVGNALTVDILNHPALYPIVSASPDLAAAIRNAAISIADGDVSPDTISRILANSTFNVLSGAQKTFLANILGLRGIGSDELLKSQYVLRHKTNAPSNWQTNIADFGVGQIYTTAKLLSEAQNASLWVYPLPGRLAYKLANIPPPPPVPGFLFGWLKSPSTETTGPNFRIDITTEYTLEQWSTTAYPIF